MDLFAELRTNPDFSIDSIEDFVAISDDSHSYLQEAIAYRPNVSLEILAQAVPIDHQDTNGQSALQYAISRGMYDLSTAIVRPILINSTNTATMHFGLRS